MRNITCYHNINSWLWKREAEQSKTTENDNALNKFNAAVAISQLDIYQQFSLSPQTEGYIRISADNFLLTISNISSIDTTLDIGPNLEMEPAFVELSPFIEVTVGPTQRPSKNIFWHASASPPQNNISTLHDDPCEALKLQTILSQEQSISPPHNRGFGTIYRNVVQYLSPLGKNYELKVKLWEEEESLARANFDSEAKMLMYDKFEPTKASLRNISKVKGSKSIFSDNGTNKSILKNKYNRFEESERIRANFNDSLTIQDFLHELDYRERARVEESIRNPKLRQIQVNRYNNGEFI